MMADPSRCAQENHRRGNFLRKNHRIMTSPTDHAMRLAASLAHCYSDLICQRGVHRYSPLIEQRLIFHTQLPAICDCLGLPNQFANRCVSNIVGTMSHVQTYTHLACNSVGYTGPCVNSADRGDQSRLRPRDSLYGNNPLRGPCQSVASKMHGRRTRMIRVSRKYEFHSALACYRIDNSERQAQVLENRPLFDVKLQIAKNILAHSGLRNLVHIDAKVF